MVYHQVYNYSQKYLTKLLYIYVNYSRRWCIIRYTITHKNTSLSYYTSMWITRGDGVLSGIPLLTKTTSLSYYTSMWITLGDDVSSGIPLLTKTTSLSYYTSMWITLGDGVSSGIPSLTKTTSLSYYTSMWITRGDGVLSGIQLLIKTTSLSYYTSMWNYCTVRGYCYVHYRTIIHLWQKWTIFLVDKQCHQPEGK